jgi:CheY-like chemotaxis protein
VTPARRKVLVVDDDPDLRRLGEISLSKVARWDVVVGSSGREAVALAAAHVPDVVLLDVSMPDMDGPAALAEIRRDPRSASIPVVFITARALPQEIDALLALGAAGVMTKPFDAVRLAERLSALLGWEGQGILPPAKPKEPTALEAALAAQRAEYASVLPRRIEALTSALAAAREKGSVPMLEAARVLAHKLRGSAGSHGLLTISEAAAAIEEAIRHAEGDPAASGLWAKVDAGLRALGPAATP